MKQRKRTLGKTAKYLYQLIADGKPLPPSMRRGSIEYVKCSYWQTLNQRCANGLHVVRSPRNAQYIKNNIKLSMNKLEFDSWVDLHWQEFDALYKSGRTPSIDRICSSGDYTSENMQVIDLKENMRKDRIKPVIGTNEITGEVLFFESGKDAIEFGFCNKGISRACKLGANHKGYAWRFA